MQFEGMDQIRVTGVSGTGYHGVYDFEREQGQRFVVDVTLGLTTHRAAATDNLSNTVDYSEIARMVHDRITGEPVALLETLALRIAEDCLRDVAVQLVEVTVHKPQAPVDVPFDDISLTITRSRS